MKKRTLDMMEWDYNRTYSKKEIAAIYFPQLSHKYAWSLIADLCNRDGELEGLFRSNRRYVLPSELKVIVRALSQ